MQPHLSPLSLRTASMNDQVSICKNFSAAGIFGCNWGSSGKVVEFPLVSGLVRFDSAPSANYSCDKRVFIPSLRGNAQLPIRQVPLARILRRSHHGNGITDRGGVA